MSTSIKFDYIDSNAKLKSFLQDVRGADVVGFDTEFVSEDRYLPELCLVQVAVKDRLAVIDVLQIDDVSPFWEWLAEGSHVTVVHAAREEFRFCRQFTGKRPSRLFDTQVAAGLIGMEYPAALSTLVNRLLGESLAKGETRTNWRKRPLSDSQLQYAASDVLHLHRLHEVICDQIKQQGRESWLDEEMERQQVEYEEQDQREKWRRVSGASNFSRKELAILRAVWRWRENEARERDTPPKRVLRDDLLVELAKRGVANVKRIRSLRGMEYSRLEKHIEEIAAAIREALDLPEDEWPEKRPRRRVPQLGLLGQFLAVSLGIICRNASLAPSLVGTTEELRTLAAWRLGLLKLNESPRLATGWRKELIGKQIEQFLDGKLSLRVIDPQLDQPLGIETHEP